MGLEEQQIQKSNIDNIMCEWINNLIKMYRLSNCIKKQDQTICCPLERHHRSNRLKDGNRYTNINHKKAELGILISDKIAYKTKNVTKIERDNL